MYKIFDKEPCSEYDVEEKAANKALLFKHRMEIVRTACSVVALILNLIVMLHIYWK